MAATSVNKGRFDWGAAYASIDAVTFDASYATGGYAVPSSIGITAGTLGMFSMGGNTAMNGYMTKYNVQTNKIQVFWSGGSAAVLAEVAAGTSLAGATETMATIGY